MNGKTRRVDKRMFKEMRNCVPKVRECLMCGVKFDSSWAGHRRCNRYDDLVNARDGHVYRVAI